MIGITVAIPVKNEAANLAACLQAIGHGFAARVVVIDSGSTDGTQQIAHEWGADWVEFQWNGKFPKKRNWFLGKHRPQTDWVLFLDADEVLTEDFKQEVRKAIQDNDKVGFWLNYTIYFLGKPLKGGYPLKKLALFRVGAGEYERIDEEQWSQLDMEIHEHPVLNGPIGQIHSRIDHRDFRGIDSWIRKHQEYAAWEAKRYLQRAEDTALIGQWTFFQRLKYRLMATPFIGLVFFFGCFFLMGGFRDGTRGLAWALLKAGYFTQVYCKITELRMASNE